ncbi:Reticulon-4-interacting protein 1, mitochondrial [Tolypocladium ophioglossoides CBS 100239]|uniref:Reticulon-4-interacting protein 1, mitochondrial n=1 Tax=Tolypocladium ophioglossoides (strain CBS 100239) TaxID=1163406 RepID=A0A0L0NCJ6_TOLOC|nr:Reticulon-4-interacting protein 1, mitochondrial [Tolypocladium ophioglossoides CBS 100239]
MKAIQVTGSKATPEIVLTESLPKPIPNGSHILIRVHAAGITADEVTWPELYDTPNRVPGHDISGVVEALGPDYRGPVSVHDSVYFMLRPAAGQGGQAEYALVAPEEIAPKPTTISHAEAAALPIPILTAWEAIFEHAKLEQGSRILVTGASGAVGVMLVQLATRLLGAEVTGLASAQNHAYLKELGASRVVDYRSPGWETSIKDMDAVFDTAGGSTLSKTWSTVKPHGIIVTVADPPPPWASGKEQPDELHTYPDVKTKYFIVTAQAGPLAKVAALIDDGSVKPLPVKVFPADEAVEAWSYASQRSRHGKGVIEFVSEE